MEVEKLIIAPKRYTGESQVLSIRMPKDMLRDIDEVAEKTGRTRNELILIGIEYAFTHMEIGEKQ